MDGRTEYLVVFLGQSIVISTGVTWTWRMVWFSFISVDGEAAGKAALGWPQKKG
jgi:hypothetical protein